MLCRGCNHELTSYQHANTVYVYCTNRQCLLESKEWPVERYYFFDLGDHFVFEENTHIQLQPARTCLCGCNEVVSSTALFKSGHDSKLLAKARRGTPVSALALQWLLDHHAEWGEYYVRS